MSTWKRLLVLVLAAMMALPVFSGCKKDKEAGEQKKVSTENVEKYFLYTEAEKLYCLDATTGKSTPIGLDFAVDAVENGLVCDDSTKMVARVKKLGQEISGLIYWDGSSEKASYLGDNTDLARISKDGKYIWYEENTEGNGELCYYDTASGEKTMTVENLRRVAVSDDGKTAFATAVTTDSEILYYCQVGQQPTQIAQIVANSVNVSQDRSAVGYMKYGEQQADQEMAPVYLWTKAGGEKKLPFEADALVVFAADEIYYRQRKDGIYSQYYFDGKKSSLLYENGGGHYHKIGNSLYAYDEKWKGDPYVLHFVYKGQDLGTPIWMCPGQGMTGFFGENYASGWSRSNMREGLYRVNIEENGKLSFEFLMEGSSYSPRSDDVYNGYFLQKKNNSLYLNGNLIASGDQFEKVAISRTEDFVAYSDSENIFVYADGETVSYPKAPGTSFVYPVRGRRIVSAVQGGSITLCYTEGGAQKQITIGNNVDCLTDVDTWSIPDLAGVTVLTEYTGSWYYSNMGTMVWNK